MYTVVMGTGTDHERALTKARAIVSLPASPESLAVVVVYASETDEESPAVSKTVAFFTERGIETTVKTVDTDPQTALVEVANEREADLLCVGGREHSPAGKIQLRSGAQSVMLNADRPVLVAGEPTE
ncbi:MAG TPA: universal stress protein [Halococcus sp.]|nr:universal stress protein [Halococcus sp.]